VDPEEETGRGGLYIGPIPKYQPQILEEDSAAGDLGFPPESCSGPEWGIEAALAFLSRLQQEHPKDYQRLEPYYDFDEIRSLEMYVIALQSWTSTRAG
jgi:hypothetical protein